MVNFQKHSNVLHQNFQIQQTESQYHPKVATNLTNCNIMEKFVCNVLNKITFQKITKLREAFEKSFFYYLNLLWEEENDLSIALRLDLVLEVGADLHAAAGVSALLVGCVSVCVVEIRCFKA